MKLILFVCLVLSAAFTLRGQGSFFFANTHAPTHLYTIDGPLAGPEIYAQMLVGRTESSLEPVGPSIPHIRDGIAADGEIEVPGIGPAELAYIQMVAWDSRLWGTSLAAVPADQLGRTDIVPHTLSGGTLPTFAPYFTQSAVVPVPEPSVLLLCLIGFGGLCCFAKARKERGGESCVTHCPNTSFLFERSSCCKCCWWFDQGTSSPRSSPHSFLMGRGRRSRRSNNRIWRTTN